MEIDPDPGLEQEAEATAQRVMRGGELGVQRMRDSDVHVQRYPGEQKLSSFKDAAGESLSFMKEEATETASSVKENTEEGAEEVEDALYGDGTDINLEDISAESGVGQQLSTLAENQQQLESKVNDLSTQVEGTIFEKAGDAGTGEAIKLGTEELGKASNIPLAGLMGKLGGAAMQAIYENREQVLEILGLKGEGVEDESEQTGGDTVAGQSRGGS